MFSLGIAHLNLASFPLFFQIDAGYVSKDIYVFDFCFCNRSALRKRNQMVFVDVAVLVLGLLFNSFRCVCYLIIFFFRCFNAKFCARFIFVVWPVFGVLSIRVCTFMHNLDK